MAAHSLRQRLPSAAEHTAVVGSPIRLRALFVGWVGVCALAFIVPYADLVLAGTDVAGNSLPLGSMTLFVALLGANLLLLGRGLRRAELLLVYCMLLLAAPVLSSGYVGFLIPTIMAPFGFATDANNWADLFHRYIPQWVSPGAAAVPAFYQGAGEVDWTLWFVPMLAWVGFGMLLFTSVICLGLLFRRRWIERERLTFPLAQIPLALVGETEHPTWQSTLLGQPIAWIGLGIPILIHSYNSIHQFVPTVPAISLTGLPLGSLFTEEPWTVWGRWKVNLLFSVIGIGYLLRGEVSLSLWFFFFFYESERLLLKAVGIEDAPTGAIRFGGVLYMEQAGATIALVGVLLLTARRELWHIFRDLVRWQKGPDDAPLPNRWAALGFLGGTAGMCGWCVLAGMKLWVAIALFAAFYVMVIGLTRLVSAGGTLFIEAAFMPQDIMFTAVGTASVPPASLTIMAFHSMAYMFDQQNFLMPPTMDSYKIASTQNWNRRRFMGGVALALVTALVAGWFVTLYVIHHYGGTRLAGNIIEGTAFPFRKFVAPMLVYPSVWPLRNFVGMGIGGALLVVVTLVHRRFLWWPLSPLGLVIGGTSSMGVIWSGMFLGWFLKLMIQRLGSFRLYQRLRPLFLGLIVGEFFAAGVWTIVDALTGTLHHSIFPGNV